MGDGELVLENSPIHKYLQDIGWNDTSTFTRTNQIPLKSKGSTIVSRLQDIVKKFSNTTSSTRYLMKLMRGTYTKYSDTDLKILRDQIIPHLLEPHKMHVLELKATNVDATYHPFISFASLAIVLLLSFVSQNMYCYIGCSIISIFGSVFIFHGYKTSKDHLNFTIRCYSKQMRRLKQGSRVLLSYLRDCQIARTAYVAGVTWNKLDSIEVKAGRLEQVEARNKLFSVLGSIYQMHQEIILATLASTTMISDLDSASRYICLQSNVVLDSVDTESPSSHSLRYYLKLIEHVSSEVMWKLAIATFSNSWPSGFVNTGFVNNMLENLILLSRDAEEKAEKLEELHNNYINEQKVELAGASRVDAANAQTNCQILHNMQLLHSSLNIATLRCLDTYSFVSKVYETGSKDVSDNISTNDEVIIPTDDIISTLKSVQLNVDLAQSILQTINSALVPIEKQEIQIPAKNTIEIVQNHGNTSEQIVPYVQQGNLVFTGEGGECSGRHNEDSDEEMSQILRRNGEERKMMLVELKHVIDTQPTCLYEDGYQDFKKSGLLNPTKDELKEIYEGHPELEDEELPYKHSIDFNPFSLPALNKLQSLSTIHSLQSEMLQCEEFVGEGDLSDSSETS